MANKSLVLHATLFYATLPPWIHWNDPGLAGSVFSRLFLILTGSVQNNWTVWCSDDSTLYFNRIYSLWLYLYMILKPFACIEMCFFYCWLYISGLCFNKGWKYLKSVWILYICMMMTEMFRRCGKVFNSSGECVSMFQWQLAGCAHVLGKWE